MAIPKFPSWYRRTFYDTIRKHVPTRVSILALDLNQIIHDAAGEYLKTMVRTAETTQEDYLKAEQITFNKIFDRIIQMFQWLILRKYCM